MRADTNDSLNDFSSPTLSLYIDASGQRREKIIQDNELRFFFVFFDWAESPSVETLCTLEKICRLMRAGSCHAERERNNAEAKLMAIKLARDSSQKIEDQAFNGTGHASSTQARKHPTGAAPWLTGNNPSAETTHGKKVCTLASRFNICLVLLDTDEFRHFLHDEKCVFPYETTTPPCWSVPDVEKCELAF
ncbi:hypothetical protein OUZ56_021970 [Daphnia magna]|uniref:Uncharacterized protein n=1 Tax=Daphnia magna TaxID=35525 RepID=A0ABR0AVI5_9CRUS|nr:hypothetical protein OUZ56_021970 [Daphnia magna]